MRHIKTSLLLLLILATNSASIFAFNIVTYKVTDNIYALAGETGPRTFENYGLNNTVGFIITDDAVALIGSGGNPAAAKLISQEIKKITDKPIRWAINIGSQDHHWLGNSYFVANGAKVIALQRTVEEQKKHVLNHIARLKRVLHERADDISPVYAAEPLNSDHAKFTLGGVNFELIWPGDGHFPNDAIVWLPEQKIVFSGDLVFNDRMLGIHPFTSVIRWQKAFHGMSDLKPDYVIPGHGAPGDLQKAKRDTGDYLDWLVTEVSAAISDWQELDVTIEKLGGTKQFRFLQHFDGWHKRNISHTFLELEASE